MSRVFKLIMIGRSAFCGERNFHSIMIVAPLPVSKVSGVLKKLIFYDQTYVDRI
jgi:hypothetical protein